MSEVYEQFKMVGEDLYRLGLIDSHGGNMSIKEGDKIYITRRDCMLGHLKEDDIIEAGMEPGENDSLASREINAHRAIYKETEYTAIVHAHPRKAIALSFTENKIIPKDSEGQYLIKSVPVVKTREKIGSNEVARMLPPIYKSGYVVSVVKEHGSFAVGRNIEEAFKYTTCLEQSCEILATLKFMEKPVQPQQSPQHRGPRRAIPPSIGVMDRGRRGSRGMDRGRGRGGYGR